MKTYHNEIQIDSSDPAIERYFTDDSIFFDIETTGFSYSHCSVYLIGTAVKCGNTLIIEQFFAETPDMERDCIEAFLLYLKDYKTLISFNGGGFDIPFLTGRCDILGIQNKLPSYNMLDLYKKITGIKNLLALDSYKQKSIEHFLGISRDDRFDGGQLINVYKDYVKTKDAEAKSLLLLHNYEDIIGMPKLLDMLLYYMLCEGRFHAVSLHTDISRQLDGSYVKEIYITLANGVTVPKDAVIHNDDVHIHIFPDKTVIRVRLYEGDLGYFIPGNKKDGCISTKYAIFLPQYEDVIEPAYRKKRADRTSYFELSERFAGDVALQDKYAAHLMNTLIVSQKRMTSRAQSRSPYNP
jgi:hypothetical protein